MGGIPTIYFVIMHDLADETMKLNDENILSYDAIILAGDAINLYS
jgi:hypothetical protein